MSVSASAESRRRVGFLTRCPPPSAGGRTARRRPMGNSHDTLHEPTDRLRCRRGRAPRRLRDRSELQAPVRGRASDVPGPGDRGSCVARRRALVGSVPGSQSEGADPGGPRNNYDVRIAAARVQEARANLSVARSDLYPSFDYSGGVSRSKVGPGVLGRPGGPVSSATNSYFATMSASWELDIWGRIRRLNEAARATLFATEEARRGVWLTLVSDLGQAYFELLELDVLLQIARNSTDAYQRTYDLFLDRLQLGVASKLETSRAQGALGNAQANIPQLESSIFAKENQISILLGA